MAFEKHMTNSFWIVPLTLVGNYEESLFTFPCWLHWNIR